MKSSVIEPTDPKSHQPTNSCTGTDSRIATGQIPQNSPHRDGVKSLLKVQKTHVAWLGRLQCTLKYLWGKLDSFFHNQVKTHNVATPRYGQTLSEWMMSVTHCYWMGVISAQWCDIKRNRESTFSFIRDLCWMESNGAHRVITRLLR